MLSDSPGALPSIGSGKRLQGGERYSEVVLGLGGDRHQHDEPIDVVFGGSPGGSKSQGPISCTSSPQSGCGYSNGSPSATRINGGRRAKSSAERTGGAPAAARTVLSGPSIAFSATHAGIDACGLQAELSAGGHAGGQRAQRDPVTASVQLGQQRTDRVQMPQGGRGVRQNRCHQGVFAVRGASISRSRRRSAPG